MMTQCEYIRSIQSLARIQTYNKSKTPTDLQIAEIKFLVVAKVDDTNTHNI